MKFFRFSQFEGLSGCFSLEASFIKKFIKMVSSHFILCDNMFINFMSYMSLCNVFIFVFDYLISYYQNCIMVANITEDLPTHVYPSNLYKYVQIMYCMFQLFFGTLMNWLRPKDVVKLTHLSQYFRLLSFLKVSHYDNFFIFFIT